MDGELFAPSNGENTQQAYCSPDKMTEFSRLSRFGMTFKPLTEDHGKALLMSYLAAFHAKTSVRPGGAGIEGSRSGMWKEMARIIGEVRPRFVFVENSPMLTSRGLGVVLGDLAALGFDAKWGVISAADTGAPHLRERIWIVAYAMPPWEWGNKRQSEDETNALGYTDNNGQAATEITRSIIAGSDSSKTWQSETGESERSGEQYAQMANPKSERCRETRQLRYHQSEERTSCSSEELADHSSIHEQRIFASDSYQKKWQEQSHGSAGSYSHGFGRWPAEPNVGRVAHGVAARVDRLKAIGNGQVPRVAATAFNLLSGQIKK